MAFLCVPTIFIAEGNGNPLQYSCLENPMDGRAWWATVHGVTKSQTQLRDFTHFTSPSLFPTSPHYGFKYDFYTTLMFTKDHNGIQFFRKRRKSVKENSLANEGLEGVK